MAEQGIKNVAIIGASGNFGAPILSHLLSTTPYNITIFSRSSSSSTFPSHPRIHATHKIPYDIASLTSAFESSSIDAVISCVNASGIPAQTLMMDAAVNAGVRLFVVSEFGVGEKGKERLPEFREFAERRSVVREYAKSLAERKANGGKGLDWAGVAIGVPIDWALKKFPLLGFTPSTHTSIIYDTGNAPFTGTTLSHTAQAISSILSNYPTTRNKHFHIRSILTTQNRLLAAFQTLAPEPAWVVKRDEAKKMIEEGRRKKAEGGNWVLTLLVGQMFEEGEGRGMHVDAEGLDNAELGVVEVSEEELVRGVLGIWREE